MRFRPKSEQEQLPKVVVTQERRRTLSKTVYPETKPQDYTDVDTDYDNYDLE